MYNQFFRITILFAVILSPLTVFSGDTIHFQLRWHHQFQFAGYYAAIEKGYYREKGLEVILHEGQPDKTPVDQVLKGKADFGEANSELLYERLQGKPLVALAVIFQHSPSTLLLKKSSGINNPHNLTGRTVMTMKDVTDADFHAMFQNEGISLEKINIIQSSYDINDLISGKTDAFNAYETNEPFYLMEKKIPFTTISPRRYGVDFYSDIIFTTEKEISSNPQRVKNFLEATLKGWEYALDKNNEDEIISLLKNKYNVQKSVKHLRYEAKTMKSLILPDLVELGHMNPGRWEHMADVFLKTGMVDNTEKIKGFVYDPENREMYEKLKKQIILLTVVLAATVFFTAYVYSMNFRLKKEVRLRKEAEEQVREMAYYDNLTRLPNRNLLYDRMAQAIERSKRNNTRFAVCFIDLDNFKKINDTYGHHIGDSYLKKLSERISLLVRKTDTIARLGGDEFIIILDNITSEKDIGQVMNNLQSSFHRPLTVNNIEMKTSASIGIAIFPDNGETVESLLQKSDSAMYEIKNKVKDSYMFSRG